MKYIKKKPQKTVCTTTSSASDW